MGRRAVLRLHLASLAAVAVLTASCGGDGDDASPPPTAPETTTTTAAPVTTTTTAAPDPFARPAWLGTRSLPLRPDGFGQIQPTPDELRDRRLSPPPGLPDPPSPVFASTVAAVPVDVLARSTWREGCPVGPGDLRYVTLVFWGFDGRPHTGELLVHATEADDVVSVFRRLFEIRFPIEEMRITSRPELEAWPTGDGNNTESFVCRNAVAPGASWSQHAYGKAIDLNPFHNPYVLRDLVLPELSSAYLDRAAVRPGMVVAGDEVTRAFASIGWIWGGTWRSSKDYQHFSANGR
jgi:hypothetical protein